MLVESWSSSTSTTTSAFALSTVSMIFSATFTLSAVSRRMIALSCSFMAICLAPIRLRRVVMASLTSAFDRKNAWITRSS